LSGFDTLEESPVDIDCLCAGILFADHVCSPIERIPDAGELVVPEAMQLLLGGCAANTAVDLARVGGRVVVAGCVGDDAFGQFILDALSSGGIDTGCIRRIDGVGSASTMVINVAGTDRRFISTPGANSMMTVENIPTEFVSGARVFYVGGYLMLPGLETDAMVDLFRAARAAGTTTVLDVVGVSADDGFARLSRLLSESDVFLPNDDEARLLTGQSDPVRQAEIFRDAGAATVVITRGERGTVLVGDGVRLRAGAYPTTFVGGTGAGDAFDAGYIAGLLAGEDPAGCIRWGSALGASCVRAAGASESVFDRREAEDFMKRHALPVEAF